MELRYTLHNKSNGKCYAFDSDFNKLDYDGDVCSRCGNDDVIGGEMTDGRYIVECQHCGNCWEIVSILWKLLGNRVAG